MPKRSYDIAIPPLLDELRTAVDQAKLPPFTGELSRLLEVNPPLDRLVFVQPSSGA